jgi:Ca2+-binding EF-hand superfamily protein
MSSVERSPTETCPTNELPIMRRVGKSRSLGACSLAAAVLLSTGVARADDKSTSEAGGPTTGESPVSGAASSETRDSILMLETGPLLVRLQISVGGRSLSAAQEEYIERLFQSLDMDQDGKLSREELSRSPIKSAPRKPPNSFLQQLAREQAAARVDDRQDARVRPDLEQLKQDVDRVTTEPVTIRQDNSAADKDQDLFDSFDVDASGQVEPGEMRTAALRILDRDSDRDQCITFDELTLAPQDPLAVNVVFPALDQNRPSATRSEFLRDAAEQLVPRDIVQKYDANRDRKLSAEELNWNPERLQRLDADRDGYLAQAELTGFAKFEPDLELAVDLSAAADAEAVRVISGGAAEREESPRADLARYRIGGVALTFAFRKTDPIEDAVATAMRIFNQLDTDANGYLDEGESKTRGEFFFKHAFQEGDRDGDGKLFGDEMKEFVSARAEPVANTCRVNVYNMGYGYFQRLDTSGDGRISIREMRTVEQTLREMAGGGGPLKQGTSGLHLYVEFVRGSYQLFGPTDGMMAQTATFSERPAVGPGWFQAMDRNSDGDLTFNEFLGHLEDFHTLDVDGDGLIDFKEAERASELWPDASQAGDKASASAQSFNR